MPTDTACGWIPFHAFPCCGFHWSFLNFLKFLQNCRTAIDKGQQNMDRHINMHTAEHKYHKKKKESLRMPVKTCVQHGSIHSDVFP